VSTRARHWSAAILVSLAACVLVSFDLTDVRWRAWWDVHALTTDTVSGIVVLAITLLIVDQVVRLRQTKDRSRAIAAQAAIMVAQGIRSGNAVSQALSGSGDKDSANDEFRTYMMMLLVGAPLLIDEPTSRAFLEQAQFLGAEMTRAIGAATRDNGKNSFKPDRVDRAVRQLRDASMPLVQVLDPQTQAVIRGEEQTETS
jgi:hypothetical protein